MRTIVLHCGTDVGSGADAGDVAGSAGGGAGEVHVELPVLPGRRDLAFLTEIAAEVLPHDTAPTPEEISQQKDVPHLQQPKRAPQQPSEPVRLIVLGPDASLAAVVTHLMRRNLLWFEVAHVPGAYPSPAATNWGMEALTLEQARRGAVSPVPLIRDDTGRAIVGYALLTEPDITGTSSADGFVGEVYVDEHELFSGRSAGVQVRPTTGAPGLVAAELPFPDGSGERAGARTTGGAGSSHAPSLWSRIKNRLGNSQTPLQREPHAPIEGRAVQAGGPGFRYVRDGIETKKPREKVTIYRHLLDLQLVR